MAHDKQSRHCTETQQKESIFLFRVIRIMHEQGIVIGEYCLTFFERDAMLPLVDKVFSFVPDKADSTHIYKVTTMYLYVKFLLAASDAREGPLETPQPLGVSRPPKGCDSLPLLDARPVGLCRDPREPLFDSPFQILSRFSGSTSGTLDSARSNFARLARFAL